MFCQITSATYWKHLKWHQVGRWRTLMNYSKHRLISKLMSASVLADCFRGWPYEWRVYRLIGWSVCAPVCLSVCLSVCLYICMSVCRYIFLSPCLPISLPFSLLFYLAVCLSLHLSVCLSVCLPQIYIFVIQNDQFLRATVNNSKVNYYNLQLLPAHLPTCLSVCLSVCLYMAEILLTCRLGEGRDLLRWRADQLR